MRTAIFLVLLVVAVVAVRLVFVSFDQNEVTEVSPVAQSATEAVASGSKPAGIDDEEITSYQSDESPVPVADAQVNSDIEPEYKAAIEAFSNRIRAAIEQIQAEPVDPEWAPEMTQLLGSEIQARLSANPDLQERYSVARVDCRASACVLVIYDYGADANFTDDVTFRNMLRTMYADSLYENFEIDWFGNATLENGLYESTIVFERRVSPVDQAAVDQLRIPIALSE